jgi:predicted HTH transcriptional regulator
MTLSDLEIKQLIASGETNQVELKVASPSSIPTRQYHEIAGVPERTAYRDLEDLVARGALKSVGKTRGRIYKLP